LTQRRLQIVNFVYSRIESSGPVTLSKLFSNYRASNHPQVASGLKTEQEILNKFLEVFDANKRNPESVVSSNDFSKSMREVSAAYPIDENAFVRMMECVWSVKEQVDSVQRDLEKLEAMIKEKIRQRMPSVETEENAIKKNFKFVDLDNNGWVSIQEFDLGLRRIGAVLTVDQLESLFEKFDTNGNGQLDYAEFARFVGRKRY